MNASVASLEPHVAALFPGLHEASNPYWDWLWGSRLEAEEQLLRWLMRPSSELAEHHLVCRREDGRVVGGFIGLSGSEVHVCRKADLIAFMDYARRDSGQSVLARLRRGRALFAPVAETEFYLSRIAVAPSHRGRGVGRRLLEIFLRVGRVRGFRHFRLDVAADNTAAIRLYRAAGFDVASESAIAETDIRYVAMRLSLAN